jgi:hypothetical protein
MTAVQLDRGLNTPLTLICSHAIAFVTDHCEKMNSTADRLTTPQVQPSILEDH